MYKVYTLTNNELSLIATICSKNELTIDWIDNESEYEEGTRFALPMNFNVDQPITAFNNCGGPDYAASHLIDLISVVKAENPPPGERSSVTKIHFGCEGNYAFMTLQRQGFFGEDFRLVNS